MSTAAWKSRATSQVRVAKAGRAAAPLREGPGGSDDGFGEGGGSGAGCDGALEKA